MVFDQIEVRRWPRGLDTPIATLGVSVEQLTSCHGLHFEEVCDDLDWVRAAVIRPPGGREFALTWHPRAPAPNDVVVLSWADASYSAELDRILTILGLGQDAVRWRHPRTRDSAGYVVVRKLVESGRLKLEKPRAPRADELLYKLKVKSSEPTVIVKG